MLEDRINADTMLAGVPMDTDRVHCFGDLIPVTATPGLAIAAGLAGAAIAGSQIGANAD